MCDPLVSIIIPLYNKEEWVSSTLLTVYRQTYPNWECLIINDGSTDGSLDVITSFINSHPGNWKIISQANSGQIQARNLGIENASGDFIAFLDADDLWMPEKIESQVKTHLSNPTIGLSLTSYVIFKKDQKNGFRIVTARNSKKMIFGWLRMTGFGGLIESTGFISKTTLERFGRYSDSFSMTSGLDLSLKILSELDVVVLREPLVLYRLSPGQFHKQEDILIKDLEIMTLKYAGSPEALIQLRELHSSYLYWSKCRSQGARYFAVSVLGAILLLRRRELLMLCFLSSRNLLATIRGFTKQRMICRFLDSSTKS